jgi:hypothetical protein
LKDRTFAGDPAAGRHTDAPQDFSTKLDSASAGIRRERPTRIEATIPAAISSYSFVRLMLSKAAASRGYKASVPFPHLSLRVVADDAVAPRAIGVALWSCQGTG